MREGDIMDKLLYHGSNGVVETPDLHHTRTNIDFGPGFYLTTDKIMATKWACNKETSILNSYVSDFSKLQVYEFKADDEWLDFIIMNRNEDNVQFDLRYQKYDVIIGPTADDRLSDVIEMYEQFLLNKQGTLEAVNCMNYSNQYCFRTEKAINSILFKEYKLIEKQEKEHYYTMFRTDVSEARKRTENILRKYNGR